MVDENDMEESAPAETDAEVEAPAVEAEAEAETEAAPKKDKRRGAKKERVLHTRIPAVLELELKRLAEGLRVPVSNVVRAILEDAVDTVDVVGRKAEGELRDAAERLRSERHRLRRKRPSEAPAKDESAPEAVESSPAPRYPLEGALGFTPMVLANEAVCAVTGKALQPGDDAYLVLFGEPGRQAIVGRDALPKKQAARPRTSSSDP